MTGLSHPKRYFGTLPNREGKPVNKRGCKPHPNITCPLCYGSGQRKDAHTGKLRFCLACNGTGMIDRKII